MKNKIGIFLGIFLMLFSLAGFGQAAALLGRTTPAGAGGYDSDFQAVIDRATTEGFTLPSTSQQDLMNQLVLDLKALGEWSTLDWFAIYDHDGSEGFNTINWVDPTGTLATIVGTPSWSSDSGYTGSSSGSYINLNWSPSDGPNLTQNAGSFGYFLQNTNSITGSNGIGGSWISSNRGTHSRFISSTTIGGSVTNSIGEKTFTYTGSSSSVAYIYVRTSSAIVEVWSGGSRVAFLGSTSFTPSTNDFWVLTINNAGSQFGTISQTTVAGVSLGNWSTSNASGLDTALHDYFDNN